MDHVAWQEATEALDTVHQISQILDTGLDKETLNILIALCETGVNPEVTTYQELTARYKLGVFNSLSLPSGSRCGRERAKA